MVLEYGLVPNSGGAGKHPGGRGIRRVVKPVDHACTFNGVGERFRHAPWGLQGGEDGGKGRFGFIGANGAETPLPGKTGDRLVPGRVHGAGGITRRWRVGEGGVIRRSPGIQHQQRRLFCGHAFGDAKSAG